jgi:hypothetical protein
MQGRLRRAPITPARESSQLMGMRGRARGVGEATQGALPRRSPCTDARRDVTPDTDGADFRRRGSVRADT